MRKLLKGQGFAPKLVVTDKPLCQETPNVERLKWLMKVSCTHRRVPAM